MKKHTRKALLLSALSLLLCISMLVGSTFAWFTDSVVSARNIIRSGNLDVELYYYDDAAADWLTVQAATDVFGTDEWEPGFTKVVKFKVVNAGSLALKYQMYAHIYDEIQGINQAGEAFKLSEYLRTAVVDETATRDEILALAGDPFQEGRADLGVQDSVLEPGQESDVIAMAIWMPTTVGNEANHNGNQPQITFSINLVAGQKDLEEDSFGPDYDAAATYPAVSSILIPGDPATGLTTADKWIPAGEMQVMVPAGSPAGNYETVIPEEPQVSTNAAGETTVAFDLSLTKDGAEVTGGPYEVEIPVGQLMEVKEILHKGQPITSYTYDVFEGVLRFAVSDFSPFAYTVEPIEVYRAGLDTENRKIVGGIFEDYDPAKLDATLEGVEGDSQYMVVDYVKDGKTYYSVSERATSKILTEADSGKLWSIISSLQNNEHSTVYLKPGTYNEATTIYIYSSMDIIGLGDTEDVKVNKLSSSNSNRHLFNATGTKADYIQVTIRNMTLDATANTTGGKDNAAVQSIRKSKVKCYDLNIIKNPTNMAAIALYVNGNNAVDGVKYPAYLYVQNCTLNSQKSFSVVSTAGSYKFFHNGLTYNGTAYTQNSGSIKLKTMEATDWEWD